MLFIYKFPFFFAEKPKIPNWTYTKIQKWSNRLNSVFYSACLRISPSSFIFQIGWPCFCLFTVFRIEKWAYIHVLYSLHTIYIQCPHSDSYIWMKFKETITKRPCLIQMHNWNLARWVWKSVEIIHNIRFLLFLLFSVGKRIFLGILWSVKGVAWCTWSHFFLFFSILKRLKSAEENFLTWK